MKISEILKRVKDLEASKREIASGVESILSDCGYPDFICTFPTSIEGKEIIAASPEPVKILHAAYEEKSKAYIKFLDTELFQRTADLVSESSTQELATCKQPVDAEEFGVLDSLNAALLEREFVSFRAKVIYAARFLQLHGYHNHKFSGRPRAGEKSMYEALIAIFGLGHKTIQAILNSHKEDVRQQIEA